ncbi:SMI1/KNR4 family protein [Novipirellula caenicola]|uniref:Knr4/Smi1-like domain-containing protein n=1 Tax=Novipirellula caenicola TaxID=1536901 RepID=A0ABP9W0L7_9BACT
MQYKDLITATYGETDFNPPVSASALAEFIQRNGAIPDELSDLLRETDGAPVGDMVSIFSVESRDGYTFQSVIDEWEDAEYQQLYPNSQDLFFFAGDGMGGFFGYRRNTDGDDSFGLICYWDHETDTIQELAEQGLDGFIRTCEQYIE